MTNRPGVFVFLSGVACLLGSTSLGFYLAHEAQQVVLGTGPLASPPPEGIQIGADRDLLANVNALMWMTFGLGACLALVGLRMIVRPDPEFQPLPPLGQVGEVFEIPE